MKDLERAILEKVASLEAQNAALPRFDNRDHIEWAMDRAYGPKFQPGHWFGDDSDAARQRYSRAARALLTAGLLESTGPGQRLSRVRTTPAGSLALKAAKPIQREIAPAIAADMSTAN